MRTTKTPFHLRAWRLRLDLTQNYAAQLVGLSHSGYVAAEARNAQDTAHPCNATLAYLCMYREMDSSWRVSKAA